MIFALAWIPLAAAAVLLFLPARNERLLRQMATAATALSSALTLWLLIQFQPDVSGYQFFRRLDWIPSLGIHYQAGLDGISMTLCLLHALVSLAGVFVSCAVKERVKEYLFFYLILVGAIYGVFTSLDLFLLYLFYEMTLIPLYPMIAIWGSKNKEYGAMKLTLYITAGAVIALFGILTLYRELGLGSFDLIRITEILRTTPSLSGDFQNWLAPFFLVGFGVIASLWPLHSWSPIGYAAAPTSVSMLHAGVLKKMGPYLMIRLALALLPEGTAHWANTLAVLAGIGIIYAGLAAIWQKDLKFIIGFSSVSHMGYILLGVAAMNSTALSGAVLLMFSHGVMAAAVFAAVGFLYEQAHTRGVTDFGGLGKKTPFLAVSFVMGCLASLGLPGFSNFAAELLIFIGAWPRYSALVVAAVFGVLLTAIYFLRAVQHIFYGPPNPRWNQLEDAVTFSQKFPFVLLIGALLLFGFWPQGLLRMIQPAAGVIFP